MCYPAVNKIYFCTSNSFCAQLSVSRADGNALASEYADPDLK
jgi:hypothetical protein